MEQPGHRVDVITRTRDRLPLLERALLSLRAQTHTEWHLYLLNDGGDAKALEALVAGLELDGQRITILHDGPHTGNPTGAQINFALEKGNGTFAAVLDDSNWWPENFLAEMLAAIGDKPAVCCRSFHTRTYLESGRLEARGRELYNPWWNGLVTPWRLLESPIFEAPSFLFRRKAWEKLRFAEVVRIYEVYEFASRLAYQEELAFCAATWADASIPDTCPSGVDWGLSKNYEQLCYVELINIKAAWVRQAAREGNTLFGNLVTQSLHQNQLFAKLDGLERITALGLGQIKREEKEIKAAALSDEVEIAFALDERFLFPLAVALQSLSQNFRPISPLKINILACGQLALDQSPLESTLKKDPRFHYKIHSVESLNLAHLRTDFHFSPANYARLLIPDLKISAKYCVYFDCDILFLGCIAPLLEQSKNVEVLAAAKDYLGCFKEPGLGLSDLSSFGIDGGDAYFNSGMLIFNLSVWRKEKIVDKCFGLARRHPELTSLCDQHLINVQLHGRIQESDAEWNYQMADYKRRKAIFAEVFETPPRWPKVLHFTTALKPWLMGYDLPWIHLYREAAEATGLPLPESW